MNINDLAAEINRQLATYAHMTDEKVQKIAKEIAIDGVKRLKLVSPKDTGDYAKSWTYKKVKGNFVIHNKEHYRLTHLLEKSHALRSGGRSTPQPHIKPTESDLINEMERRIRQELST